MMANANEIIPGLWLGNKAASEDSEWQKSENIFTVFNCTKTLPFAPNITRQYRLPVDDNLQEDEINNMYKWSSEAVYKVLKEYKSGHRILIHCHAGMQRSAALMAMVLIVLFKISTDDAKKYIREKRPIAFFPFTNFEKSIRGFEADFKKEMEQKIKK